MQCCCRTAQSLLPAAVTSHASGIGVIWLSSLSVNHCCEYEPLSVSTTSRAVTALKLSTLSGNSPGTYPPQLIVALETLTTAFIMFIQNTTSCAVTCSPFDHWYFFSLIVTVRPPLLYTGGRA